MPGQSNSWMIHIQAAWKMLEEQGPNMPIDSGLLRRVRTVAVGTLHTCPDGMMAYHLHL